VKFGFRERGVDSSRLQAGGLATYLNIDHVAERVHAHAPAAHVVGLADAGFFLDHQQYNEPGKFTYTAEMEYLYNMSHPTTNADCMAHYADESGGRNGSSCFMAQYTVPFIKSRLFIAEGEHFRVARGTSNPI
jgi:hypothetical protein